MRILSLVFALALSFGSPTASASTDAELKARFFASDYTVCDAHFVAKTFEFTTSEAKAYIGQKIEWESTSILDGDLATGREKGRTDRTWRCQFYQTGYTPDDAAALAAYWGISVSDSKVRVEEKILSGNENFFKTEVLPAAHAASYDEGDSIAAHAAADAEGMKAFLGSKYDACHAKMLVGTYFGTTLLDTKAFIGTKVAGGMTGIVDSRLDEVRARHQAADTTPCGFHETPYTMSDAEALATLWGQSLTETKTRIEQKYAFGNESIIGEDLVRAGVR